MSPSLQHSSSVLSPSCTSDYTQKFDGSQETYWSTSLFGWSSSDPAMTAILPSTSSSELKKFSSMSPVLKDATCEDSQAQDHGIEKFRNLGMKHRLELLTKRFFKKKDLKKLFVFLGFAVMFHVDHLFSQVWGEFVYFRRHQEFLKGHQLLLCSTWRYWIPCRSFCESCLLLSLSNQDNPGQEFTFT